jgi:hypothetical protein
VGCVFESASSPQAVSEIGKDKAPNPAKVFE